MCVYVCLSLTSDRIALFLFFFLSFSPLILLAVISLFSQSRTLLFLKFNSPSPPLLFISFAFPLSTGWQVGCFGYTRCFFLFPLSLSLSLCVLRKMLFEVFLFRPHRQQLPCVQKFRPCFFSLCFLNFFCLSGHIHKLTRADKCTSTIFHFANDFLLFFSLYCSP